MGRTALTLVLLLACCGASFAAAFPWCSSIKFDYTMPAIGSSPRPVKLVNDKFVFTDNSKSVTLKAINWFGFNNGQTAPDGVRWAGGTAADTDFAYIVFQFKLLGFNAVRLPFTMKDLASNCLDAVAYCSPITLQQLAARTTDPSVKVNTNVTPKPNVALPNSGADGKCNEYMPNKSVMGRYLWAVQYLVSQGMYVLVDYHPMTVETDVPRNLAKFVAGWKNVWQHITCLPNFGNLNGRVFLDLMNEPDSIPPALKDLYLGAMDALWALTPGSPIFFIEGGGQTGFNTNWGNGFVTDKSLIQQYGLSDPNPFFQALLTKPYANRTVIAPHVYGPSVTNNNNDYKGVDLWYRLTKSFGYLNKAGYCNNGKCQIFPTFVGEFGSLFTDPRDLVHLQDFSTWMNGNDTYKTLHNPVPNWSYWCWNANSGDTGGIMDPTWRNLEWVKLRFLRDKLGLRMWYMQLPASR